MTVPATASTGSPSALLFDLLTRAAGFDPQKVRVRSIECRAAVDEIVMFDVQLEATDEMIQKAFNEMADEGFAAQLGAVATMLGNKIEEDRKASTNAWSEAKKEQWMRMFRNMPGGGIVSRSSANTP